MEYTTISSRLPYATNAVADDRFGEYGIVLEDYFIQFRVSSNQIEI